MIASPPRMVHVAIGGLAGAALARVVSPVVVADDNLLLGPSSVDLKRHLAARARYWGSSPSPDLARELARGSGPALCVDLPPTPCGLLTLGQICSIAIACGRDVLVAGVGSDASATPLPGIDPAPEVYLDPEDIQRRRSPAAPWSRLQAALAATLWRLWCRPSPVAFSKLCAAGSTLHPQIASLGRYHAGIFPRLVDRRLRLSRLDELLLGQLSEEWLTPAEVFVNASASGSALEAWISHTGDVYVARRLLAWSRHTHGRIVERRKRQPASDSEMTAWSFRWRPGGEALLEVLPSLEAAPPVALGGAVAHDSARPWVCRLDAAGGPYVSRSGSFGS